MNRGHFIRVLAVLSAVAGLQADDWPQWRGPERLNASHETGLLDEWPAGGPPLVWRATGIGVGIHSVSVSEGRVFVVGNRDGGVFAFALDETTGTKLWATRVDEAIEENPRMRWLTQRSPTVDEDRVYIFNAYGELVCLRSATGKIVWTRNYQTLFGANRPVWGFCDYPLVDGDRLICSPYSAVAAMAALDKHTGQVLWQTSLDDRVVAGYAAAVRGSAGGVPQYVMFHGSGLAGFAAEDGRLLWRFERPRTRNGSTYAPICLGNLIVSPNGYGGGLVAFEILANETRWDTVLRYQVPLWLDAFQDSSVVAGGRLYLIENGLPVCLDPLEGTRLWGDGTAVSGQQTAATWAQGHLYLRTIGAEIVLLKVTEAGTSEAGRFRIPESHPAVGVTTPVVANGRLWVRDDNRLFSYDISETALRARPSAPAHVAIGLTDGELGDSPKTLPEPRTGTDRAPDAVFVPTPHDIVNRMLAEAGVGRIVIAATKNYRCEAVGYEIDEQLVKRARENLVREKVEGLARIEHEDLFTVDLSPFDVVTTFLYPRLMQRLIPQFEELKPGSRIVSHQFEIPGFQPDKVLLVRSDEDGEIHRVLVWITPLKAAVE